VIDTALLCFEHSTKWKTYCGIGSLILHVVTCKQLENAIQENIQRDCNNFICTKMLKVRRTWPLERNINSRKIHTFSIMAQSKEFTESHFFCITEAWFSIFYFSLQATKVSWTVLSSFKY
jgi:hypothetical protein